MNGKIVSKGGPVVPIPENGYVIFVSNTRVNQWTKSIFPVGARVDYKVVFWDHSDRPYPNTQDWENIKHAIGCGPRLVANGAVAVNPVAERFTEDKQNTLSSNRGAVGVTRDNIVMFVTCTSMTPHQFRSHAGSGLLERHADGFGRVIGPLVRRPISHGAGQEDQQRVGRHSDQMTACEPREQGVTSSLPPAALPCCRRHTEGTCPKAADVDVGFCTALTSRILFPPFGAISISYEQVIGDLDEYIPQFDNLSPFRRYPA